ncbi:hypothetical protein ATY37_20595 [Vibrio cidicii]|uniref:Conserved hypothetical protein CHP02391 domain-containing protein n=1 Tax=Vibrio cidicii TaxID=1763883 RepID=A0A151KUA9_9VIBR|nr:TIGR02391 family protein [Vibrio cidicii]KYN82632.1 hypothetical protein ATY37_20595 [Vibrio cidicii]
MTQHRSDAINRIVSELEAYEINLNQYYDVLELQNVIDKDLVGKIDTLKCFCQTFGWSNLVGFLEDLLPLQGDAIQALERVQGFVIPEIKHQLESESIDSASNPTDWYWSLIHPRIKALAKPRFDAGFRGDAVEAVFKEVNDAVKLIFVAETGRESDGAGLMNTAFSPQNPVIKLSDLETETDRNIQQGYMQIMAGAMIGIRNPKAHSNLNPDANKALHLISLASLLMCKVDERI